MSAWLVSKAHIDALVYARRIAGLNDRERDPFGKLSDNALGRALWRENMLSLKARYDDPIDDDGLASYQAAAPIFEHTSVVVLIKAIHCYEYQSCEHDAWEESESRRFCRELENALTHKLTGYDAAPWGL